MPPHWTNSITGASLGVIVVLKVLAVEVVVLVVEVVVVVVVVVVVGHLFIILPF